jgi:hypothetical protein
MWLWHVNNKTELVSDLPAPQFGDEGRSRFKVQAVPAFRFDLCKVRSHTPGVRANQLEDHCSVAPNEVTQSQL